MVRPKKMAVNLLIVGASALGMLISFSLYAQVAGGTITGTINDTSGAVMPNVQLSIRDISTDIVRTVTTDAAGFYTAPNLLPGTYEVTVSAPGFSTQVRSGITLTVGVQQVLNLTMAVGQATQKVQVTGEVSAVQLATSSLSNNVNASTVRELPLNGRDWTSLATLQPGVGSVGSIQQDISNGNTRVNRGYGTELVISGARPQQNNYRLDGITVNDYSNSGPASVLGVALGVDAIQEFSVLSSNYSAEYGRTSGGIINAVTRSGTNQLHGDVYEFLRNSALDAPTFFDNQATPVTVPPFRRNQFGGSAGGPIRKDRTFVFGDYEGLRQSLGVTHIANVPSLDARNGIIHNSDGTTTAITVDPLVQPFLSLYHPPNGHLLGTGNTGIYSFSGNQIISENFVTAHVDQRFSEKDSLFGSYQFDKAVLTLPDTLNVEIVGNKSLRESLALEESHIFTPQLVNSFRLGYNRVDGRNTGISAINPAAADPSLGAVPGHNAPQVKVPGLQAFTGGLNSAPQTAYYYNSFQGYDDAFLTKGTQALKFGVAVERIEDNAFQPPLPGGTYSFRSLVGFLTNEPFTFSAGIPSEVAEIGLRQSIFGVYVQDDARWRPNFTMNLGMRYEISTVPTEPRGRLSTLRNITDPTPHLGSPYFSNPTLRNFEPRVGFAWDPFRNGRTSVRGGFGLFDVLPLIYEYNVLTLNAAPFNVQGTAVPPLAQGSFPKGAFLSLSAPNHLRNAYIEPNPHRNYVMQWNINLQRELTPSLTATVAYVGSRGVHQPFRGDDENMVLPTLTSAGYLWPSPAGSGTQLNPNAGRMDYLTWSSNTAFNALELQIAKRMSHGFQAQGSYTWGKTIDEGSQSVIGDPFGNSISSLYFFDPRTRRGVADFNISQNLTVNYTWNIPTPQSLQGATAWAVRGWQLGGILTVESGLPFTPILGGDPLGINSTDPWDFPNRLVGPGCQSLTNPGNVNNYIKLQCFAYPNPGNLLGNAGRNSLTGPGLATLDFSLFKNNYVKRISESFNAQVRVEVFNSLNHPNFEAPNDNNTLFDQGGAPTSGAGLIDLLSTSAREIQFALKLIW